MGRIASFVHRHVPRRETIHENRLLRPFAHHLGRPNLWHLNHRSVPRAVALGLGVGVMIPFMHMVVAALLAVPVRANIAVSAGVTLVVNPLTIPPLYWAAYHVGKWELHRGNDVDPAAMAQVTGEVARFLFWMHQASGPIALGILTIAASAALIGYVASAFLWKRWIFIKYRARRSIRRFERRHPS